MSDIRYTLENTKEPGNPTVRIDTADGHTAYLHSRLFPSKEKAAGDVICGDITASIVIYIGTGLGYYLPEKFDANVKTVFLIDIIPFKNGELPILHALEKSNTAISFIPLFGLDSGKIRTRLESLVSIDRTTKISIIEHPASVRLFPEQYKQIRSVVDMVIRSKIGNITTKNSFSRLFIRNCLKKIPALNEYTPFSAYTGIFKNKSCMVLSSAPSVDSYINLISEYRNRFIIICIDSAYSIAKSRGISPDFIFSSDPQPWTEEHLFNADKSIPIITSLSSHEPGIRFEKKILYMNTHPFSQLIEQISGETITADSKTGTVAGDALYAAIQMGFENIFLTGADFSFPGQCIYSKDSLYNRRYSCIFNSRLRTCETLHEQYIRRSPRNSQENVVRTRSSFLQFHDKINNIIGSQKSSRIYHLCGGGIPLDNAKLIENTNQAKEIFSKLSTDINTKLLISSDERFPLSLSIKTCKTLSQKKIFSEIINASASEPFSSEQKEKMFRLLLKVNQ
jgi:hypothetical protein